MFRSKIKVTFIDKNWNRIKTNVKVDSVPRTHELIYLGKDYDYYRVSNVIHWPNKNSSIFILIESLTEYEIKYKNIEKLGSDEDKGNT